MGFDFAVLTQYLIVCPLVMLAGFVDAAAGGGGLISLPAYMISGVPVHTAIGTNKLSSAMGTTLTTWRFARNGFIQLKQAFFCVLFALAGSSLGANIALIIDDYIFKIIMLFLLPATTFYVTKAGNLGEKEKGFSEIKTILISLPIAFFIGMYDGFYGPGTGTFLLLLLTGAASMSLQKAAGITKAINLATNVAALSVFIYNGKVDFQLGIIAGMFGIAGNYLGSRAFIKNGSRFVRPLIIAVLTIFFIKVLWEILNY